MSKNTSIQWCDSTVNPTSGCDGCELERCYAQIRHNRFHGPNARGFYAKPFNEPTWHPGRIAKAARWSDLTGTDRPDKPWLNGRPRHIFIGDMADNFCVAKGKAIAEHFCYLHMEVIWNVTYDRGARHIWLWLTKLPEQMVRFAEYLAQQGVAWPPNLVPMTTVTSQETLYRFVELCRGVRLFGEVPLGISVEPLLGPLDLRPILDIALECSECAWTGIEENARQRDFPDEEDGWECPECKAPCAHRPLNETPSWIIVGGETGPGARPCDVAWIERISKDCEDTPVFVKQLGDRPVIGPGPGIINPPIILRREGIQAKHGADPSEWPEHLRRREMISLDPTPTKQ